MKRRSVTNAGCEVRQIQSGKHFKFFHLKEESVSGCNLVLDGNYSVGEGEDVSGDALRLLLHQLLLLLVLLPQSSQSRLLLLLQKLTELLKLLLDLLLRGLNLVLAQVVNMKTQSVAPMLVAQC